MTNEYSKEIWERQMYNMENIYKSYNATERYMGNLNEGETDDEYRLHQQAMDLFKEDIR